ncbi:MAG: DUF551 domain-containing protein [Spirochaetales bacterium]|nr:DUF551 domain-containing protein [Spirochaetales bacterium]
MDDLISRQAAIGHAISGLTREIDGERWIRVAEVRESLKTMPSAHQWISVSERLPDFGMGVLLNEGYSCAVGYLIKTTEGKYEWGVNGWYNDLEDWSVWMPLPEPYKEGKGDD